MTQVGSVSTVFQKQGDCTGQNRARPFGCLLRGQWYKVVINGGAVCGTPLETHSSKACFLLTVVRQDSRKLECEGGTAGPLSHTSVRMKVKESGRPVCGREALWPHVSVVVEALPSSLGPWVLLLS